MSISPFDGIDSDENYLSFISSVIDVVEIFYSEGETSFGDTSEDSNYFKDIGSLFFFIGEINKFGSMVV